MNINYGRFVSRIGAFRVPVCISTITFQAGICSAVQILAIESVIHSTSTFGHYMYRPRVQRRQSVQGASCFRDRSFVSADFTRFDRSLTTGLLRLGSFPCPEYPICELIQCPSVDDRLPREARLRHDHASSGMVIDIRVRVRVQARQYCSTYMPQQRKRLTKPLQTVQCPS